MLRRSIVSLAAALCCGAASAEAPPGALDRLDLMAREGTSETTGTPIFSQLVVLSLPDEFRFVAPETRKGHIARKAVPIGETVGRWTQMIVVSGDEALAFSATLYPQKIVDDFAARTKKACGETFAALPLPGVFVGSYDTAAVVAACGSAAGRSEATLLMAVRGGSDLYTIEWTVRGAASRAPPKLDAGEWTSRLRRLAPVRLCAIVAGEQAPFPSCARRR